MLTGSAVAFRLTSIEVRGIGDHNHGASITNEISRVGRDALCRGQPLPGGCVGLNLADDPVEGRVVLEFITLIDDSGGVEFGALGEILCRIDNVVVVGGNRREECRVESTKE